MVLLDFSERVNKICNAVKVNSSMYPNCKAVFLFGSFLRQKFPNDIDLLIVYDDSDCNINYQIDELSLLVESVSMYSVDVTALSENELKETSFLERLNNNFIKIL